MDDSAVLKPGSRVHIVGIGGAGMSAIAKILKSSGFEVSGSDGAQSEMLDELVGLGIDARAGHDAAQVEGADYVTHSTAIPEDNVELAAASDAGIPIYNRAATLAAVTTLFRSLLVAGTHGKTTTSSMLASLLMHLQDDPSFVIGGRLAEFDTAARRGAGPLLVVEADESDGTFLELANAGCIITNVEPDHLEFHGSFDNLKRAFQEFAASCEGPVIVCADDPGCRELFDRSRTPNVSSYGFSEDADFTIRRFSSGASGSNFDLETDIACYQVAISQPGEHNALNAVAAMALAIKCGFSESDVVQAASKFKGVARRYEFRGEAAGVRFVDDYAHLPTEVEAAISAGKSENPSRLIAVFQPHRYSRTQALASQFGFSFGNADKVVITGIYPSGEQPREGVSGKLVADQIGADSPQVDLTYVETLSELEDWLAAELNAGDLCLTMGAGDLTKVPDSVIERLSQT